MTPEQTAAIERLRELAIDDGEKWFATADCAFEARTLDKVGQFNNSYEAINICALRNEALPLIEALAAENKRLLEELNKLEDLISQNGL